MQRHFKNSRDTGDFFEEAAAAHLASVGYSIKDRNYSTRYGEIDIIAEEPEKHTLIFVEVKARDKATKTHPFEFVDSRKQKNIIMAAKDYMLMNNVVKSFIRFDVVGLITSGKNVEKIEVLKDAFQA
jgi:putative endonuclease